MLARSKSASFSASSLARSLLRRRRKSQNFFARYRSLEERDHLFFARGKKTPLTVAQGLGGLGDRVADAVVDLANLGALEQLLKARHDGVEAELVLGAVLGATQVRRQQDLCAVVDKVLEGGDRGADASVVGDLEVLVERDVEVGADLRIG